MTVGLKGLFWGTKYVTWRGTTVCRNIKIEWKWLHYRNLKWLETVFTVLIFILECKILYFGILMIVIPQVLCLHGLFLLVFILNSQWKYRMYKVNVTVHHSFWLCTGMHKSWLPCCLDEYIVWWLLMFVYPQYSSYCSSPFWDEELSGGF